MHWWWRDLTGLAMPVDCAGCGGPRTVLCGGCRAQLRPGAARQVRPAPLPPGLPPVYAAAGYGGVVRSVLLAHKERGVLPLAGPLGAALAGAVRTAGEALGGALGGASCAARELSGGQLSLLLVPVPSARRAVAARGHDPTRRIALAAAGELRRAGLAARVFPVLRQRRQVADQSGLSAGARVANMSGALEASAGAGRLLASHFVVLVDDLLTTGASLAEAARAVAVAGGRAVAAAVVASGAQGGEAVGAGARPQSGEEEDVVAGRTPVMGLMGATRSSGVPTLGG